MAACELKFHITGIHYISQFRVYLYTLVFNYIFFSFSFSLATASSLALALLSDRLLLSRRNDSRSDFFKDFLRDIGVSDVPVKSVIRQVIYHNITICCCFFRFALKSFFFCCPFKSTLLITFQTLMLSFSCVCVKVRDNLLLP